MTMSFEVLPSPQPFSGSSLDTCVITASATPRPRLQLSVTAVTRSAIVNVWTLWFGRREHDRADHAKRGREGVADGHQARGGAGVAGRIAGRVADAVAAGHARVDRAGGRDRQRPDAAVARGRARVDERRRAFDGGRVRASTVTTGAVVSATCTVRTTGAAWPPARSTAL